MTKAEAIKILVNDFQNQCIACDWAISDVDREICKALKIKVPNIELDKPKVESEARKEWQSDLATSAEPQDKPPACPIHHHPQLTCPLSKSDDPQFVISIQCCSCIQESKAAAYSLGQPLEARSNG